MNIRAFVQPASHKTPEHLSVVCVSWCLRGVWAFFSHWVIDPSSGSKSAVFPKLMIQAIKKAGSWLCYKKLTVISCSLGLIYLQILSPKSSSLSGSGFHLASLYSFESDWVGCVIHSYRKISPWNWLMWPGRELKLFLLLSLHPSSPPHLSPCPSLPG